MTRNRIELSGFWILRYGLVLVLAWIGGMKFTAYEAAAIGPLLESNPFLAWVYLVASERAVSSLIGLSELLIALLIALRPLSPRLSALGSVLAIPLFLTTLSFLFTLPGWEPTLGFPILGAAGGFLVKDVILLGAAVTTAGEALDAGSA